MTQTKIFCEKSTSEETCFGTISLLDQNCFWTKIFRTFFLTEIVQTNFFFSKIILGIKLFYQKKFDKQFNGVKKLLAHLFLSQKFIGVKKLLAHLFLPRFILNKHCSLPTAFLTCNFLYEYHFRPTFFGTKIVLNKTILA